MSKDVCESKIVKKKVSTPVTVNNKVCDYDSKSSKKGVDSYGKKEEHKPSCRIEKTTQVWCPLFLSVRMIVHHTVPHTAPHTATHNWHHTGSPAPSSQHVESFDFVTEWKCLPEKSQKTTPVKLETYKVRVPPSTSLAPSTPITRALPCLPNHTPTPHSTLSNCTQDVCKTYTETEHQTVHFEVVERKCQVEQYFRTVCDGDKVDSHTTSGIYSGSDDYQKVPPLSLFLTIRCTIQTALFQRPFSPKPFSPSSMTTLVDSTPTSAATR